MKFIKNITIANLIDFCIINFSVFLITFAWVRFWSKNLGLAISIGLLVCLFVSATKYLLRQKKTKAKGRQKEDEKNIDRLALLMLSCDNCEMLEIIEKSLLAQNLDVSVLEFGVIENKGCFVAPIFEEENLRFEKAIKGIKWAKEKGFLAIKILCVGCDKNVKIRLESVQNIKVEIYEKEEIYYKIFMSKVPQVKGEIVFESGKKYKVKELFSIAIRPEKSKKYFICGVFIFLCSVVVRYNIYYVFMSSLLFLLSILSRRRKEKIVE